VTYDGAECIFVVKTVETFTIPNDSARVTDVIHGYGGMFPMHGPLPPYGMIMEYKRLLEGAALPGSLNYQYLAANYFQLHSKCAKTSWRTPWSYKTVFCAQHAYGVSRVRVTLQ